jgi:hypothetical protein
VECGQQMNVAELYGYAMIAIVVAVALLFAWLMSKSK